MAAARSAAAFFSLYFCAASQKTFIRTPLWHMMIRSSLSEYSFSRSPELTQSWMSPRAMRVRYCSAASIRCDFGRLPPE